jgi:hypothetical protein
MNPGKVIDPHLLDEHLKLGADYNPWRPPVRFAYEQDNGDFAHAMLRCVGIGKCRVPDASTVMCPSYMVTRGGEVLHPWARPDAVRDARGRGHQGRMAVARGLRRVQDPDPAVRRPRNALHVSQVIQMAREHGPHRYRSGLPEQPYYEVKPQPSARLRGARAAALGAGDRRSGWGWRRTAGNETRSTWSVMNAPEPWS